MKIFLSYVFTPVLSRTNAISHTITKQKLITRITIVHSSSNMGTIWTTIENLRQLKNCMQGKHLA